MKYEIKCNNLIYYLLDEPDRKICGIGLSTNVFFIITIHSLLQKHLILTGVSKNTMEMNVIPMIFLHAAIAQ